MKLRDLSELAARNLREAILRNSLTTLGVAVGVASLVAMLSLGVGLQTLASDRLTKSGLFDAIFVSSRRDFRGGPGGDGPRKPPADSTKDKPKENPKPLDEAARLQFAALPNVTDVYPQIRFFTDVRFDNNNYSTNVLGVPNPRAPPAPSTASSANIFLHPPPKKPSFNKTSPKISPLSPPP